MPIIRMKYLMSSFWSAMPNLSKLYHPIGATMEKCAVNLQIGVPKKAAKGNNPKSQCPEMMSHAPKCVCQIAKGCTDCMEDSPSDHAES